MNMSRRTFVRIGMGGAAAAVLQAQPLGAAFARTGASALSGSQRFPGDPGLGRLYYGASIPTDVVTWEAQLNQRLSVHRTYHQASQVDRLANQASTDLTSNRLPHVSIKPPGTWRSVARGDHDAWLSSLGTRLGQLGRPVFLTVHHEPENDAGGEGMHGRGFVAMNNAVISVMARRAPKVTVVPVLQGWSFSPLSGEDPVRWNVPDAAVYGVDVYNPWSPTNGKPWVTFAEKLGTIKAYAQGRPLAIGEYGCRTDPTWPGRAAEWMNDAFRYARDNNIVSMSYFNSGRNSPDGTWELDSERGPVFSEKLASDAVARV